MRKAPIMSEARIDKRAASGGYPAPGASGCLSLAAAPTFAAMALWTGLSSGQSDAPATIMQHASPLHAMTLMYCLMGVFHFSPWMQLISGRRCRGAKPSAGVWKAGRPAGGVLEEQVRDEVALHS